MLRVYAESGKSPSRQILENGRAGQTRAGRANGQSLAEERRALQYMTPSQITQSARRYVQQTAGNTGRGR